MRVLMTAALVAVFLFATPVASVHGQGQHKCMPYDDAIRAMSQAHYEQHRFTGITLNQKAVIQLWASEKTEGWTVIVVLPGRDGGKVACLIVEGYGHEFLSPPA